MSSRKTTIAGMPKEQDVVDKACNSFQFSSIPIRRSPMNPVSTIQYRFACWRDTFL